MNYPTFEHMSEKDRYHFLRDTLQEFSDPFCAQSILRYAAHMHQEKVALIYKDTYLTYHALYMQVKLFARVLQAQGVRPGDIVIVCLENTPAFYVAYYAVWQLGAVVTPINTFLTEYELAHIVDDANPSCIVTFAQKKAFFLQSSLNEEKILVLPEVPELQGECDNSQQMPSFTQEALAALLYTSGTTGVAKGVMLSSKNILTNILQSAARLGVYKSYRIFAILPLFHVFAQNTCVWMSVLTGSTIVLVPKIDRRYLLENMKHKPTIFLGVPALYGLLCLLKTVDLSSVELFISGGDALPDKIRSYFSLLYHRKIANGYGLTETAPVIAVDLEDYISPSGCVGRPLHGIICSIRNDNQQEVNVGEIGQLWVKGDMVMQGYYNASQETGKVMHDGFFNTGDCAYMTKDGRLVISGREKDLIISKGLNIYPQEIENALLSHPLVVRAGVVGKEHEEVGQVPVAFVQVTTIDVMLEKELLLICKQKLAPYKIPKQFIFQTSDLPLTATNKIDKKKLRTKIEQ